MVQRKAFGAALVGLALLFALVTGAAFAQTIATSKHNLGASGPGTIKAAAGQTTEICVFCHTPHGANMTTTPKVPLWNKSSLSGATYTLYSSTYLTGLSYPSPVLAAGQSSRICLTCHDGTVALGSVVNAPGSGSGGAIQMANTGVNFAGGMPVAAAGYLGTNLADDHPLGYSYQAGVAAGQDPELVVRGWPWPAGVQLDPNTSAGLVECKSCHNAHDNQYTKFLRVSNVNGALCTTCHNKTGWVGSGHQLSSQIFLPWVGALATGTVANRACLGCHKPHTAAANTPILKGAEETTCYDVGCHGDLNLITGNTTQGQNNIKADMNKASRHPTNTLSGLHTSPYTADGTRSETPAQLGSANRHAECRDCHSPHQVQVAVAKNLASRVPGGIPLRISAALTGTWGVEPNYAALTPTTPTTNAVTNTATPAMTFTKVSGASLTDEYQVCFKCHSAYVTLPGTSRDIAAQANPKYSSYHGLVPLVGPATALVAATQQNNATNFFVNQNTMAQPWAGNAAYTAAQAEACRLNPTTCTTFAASRGRVWCSDCHGSDATPTYPQASKSTLVPSGAHGSANVGAAPGTTNTDKMLIATIASTGAGTPLCLRCHLQTVYTGANFAFSRAAAGRVHLNGGAYRGYVSGCFTCHMWDRSAGVYVGTGRIFPHGMNKKWVNVTDTGVANAVANQHMVDSFIAGYQSTINYSAKTCITENSGTCSGRSGGY